MPIYQNLFEDIKENATLKELRIALDNIPIDYSVKEISTWTNVKSFFKSLPTNQVEKIFAEIVLFELIWDITNLRELEELLEISNIDFKKTNVRTWNNAFSFLRTLEYKTIEKIWRIFRYFEFAIIPYSNPQIVKESINRMNLSDTKNSFKTWRGVKKFLFSLEEKDLVDIAKDVFISLIFDECPDLNLLTKLLNEFEWFQHFQPFHSKEEARQIIFKEFDFDYLELIFSDYEELLSDFYDEHKFEIEDKTKIKKINEEKTKKEENLAENPLFIFISYAIKDSKMFRISEIANLLKKFPIIKNVVFFEEDSNDDIWDFMEDNLRKCDILLLFCSKNSLKAVGVKDELKAAWKLKKPIIPIFIDQEDIPLRVTWKRGVQFNESNLNKTVEEIHNRILKKIPLQ